MTAQPDSQDRAPRAKKHRGEACTSRWAAPGELVAVFVAAGAGYALALLKDGPWRVGLAAGLVLTATVWAIEGIRGRAVRAAHVCGFGSGVNEIARNLGGMVGRQGRPDR